MRTNIKGQITLIVSWDEDSFHWIECPEYKTIAYGNTLKGTLETFFHKTTASGLIQYHKNAFKSQED